MGAMNLTRLNARIFCLFFFLIIISSKGFSTVLVAICVCLSELRRKMSSVGVRTS